MFPQRGDLLPERNAPELYAAVEAPTCQQPVAVGAVGEWVRCERKLLRHDPIKAPGKIGRVGVAKLEHTGQIGNGGQRRPLR